MLTRRHCLSAVSVVLFVMFETSMPGVFAADDAHSGAHRRVAAAVGEGSAAIYSVHRYLRTV